MRNGAGLTTTVRMNSTGRLRSYIRSLREATHMARYYFGRFPRECSVCGYKGKFLPYWNSLTFGVNFDVLCPDCLSLERHRLLVLCDCEKDLFSGRTILHFAPEPSLRAYIAARGPRRYVTCQYGGSGGDLDIDIEKINIPDNEFDLIICSHVLEHVNDAKALLELVRILSPRGTLLAMTPVIEGWAESFEDPTKLRHVDDRLLYFNQHDHVRLYGRDIRTKLTEAGFRVEEFTAEEPFVSRYGLLRGEKVFICQKL